MAADAKKFHDVWVMNEQEVKELLFKAVAQDRLIHEHQLGLEYQEPNLYADLEHDYHPVCHCSVT